MSKYFLKNESDILKRCFHRVQEGEKLFDIAAAYNTTAHLLAHENNLKGEVKRGDLLLVTVREGNRYTVKEGDTLKTISVIYNKSEEDILLKNEVKFIYTGMTLLI